MLVETFAEKDRGGNPLPPGTFIDLGEDVRGNKLGCYWKAIQRATGANGTGPKIVSFQITSEMNSKSGGVKWDVLVRFLEMAAQGKVLDVCVVGELSSFNGSLNVPKVSDVKSIDDLRVKFIEVWQGVKKEGGGGKLSDEDFIARVGDRFEHANTIELLGFKTGLGNRMADVVVKGKAAKDGSEEKAALLEVYKCLKMCFNMVEKKIKELSIEEEEEGQALPF